MWQMFKGEPVAVLPPLQHTDWTYELHTTSCRVVEGFREK